MFCQQGSVLLIVLTIAYTWNAKIRLVVQLMEDFLPSSHDKFTTVAKMRFNYILTLYQYKVLYTYISNSAIIQIFPTI